METILDNLIIYFTEYPDTGTQHRDNLMHVVTAKQSWLANDHAAMLKTMAPGIGYAQQDEEDALLALCGQWPWQMGSWST